MVWISDPEYETITPYVQDLCQAFEAQLYLSI